MHSYGLLESLHAITPEDTWVDVGVPTPELMAVIDQHMEAIKVVYPSEYNAIVADTAACTRRRNYYLSNSVKHLSHS